MVIYVAILLLLGIEVGSNVLLYNQRHDFFFFVPLISLESIPRSSITGLEGKNIFKSYCQIGYRKSSTNYEP